MAGYFGTETQRRLQARVEASQDFIRTTPGACEAGRMMSCDNLDRLGWDRILEFLQRDGICGFRLIPADEIAGLRERLARHGYRLDTWDVFLADAGTALSASDAILAAGLPKDLRDADGPVDPEGDDMRAVQSLMSEAGVVPFSGSMLSGEHGPATTVVVAEADGTPVAAAHAYLPHNTFSDFRGYAWGGLVAVAERHRGRGLGNHVNARAVAGAVRDLGATHVYELVSATNAPSRRMVESCGLRHEPALVSGMAVPADGGRFTR
jgi:GNAT superfamily N-acetyltransferase